MAEKLSMIPVKDLLRLEIECPKCGTIVTLDVTRTNFFPEQCPACPTTFNGFVGNAPQAFRKYIEFYRTFAESSLLPRFRISGDLQ